MRILSRAAVAGASGRVATVVTMVVAVAVFVFAWLFRFNDPSGSFAGLTDDHLFYLVRAWQITFGELPVRDFVDHGAPLYYYAGAAVQVLFGRGTVSELAFSSTMLALAAALTFWLAARGSGSLVAGLAGAAFHVLLAPRFYNYPKVLVYAVALPLLWRFAETRSPWVRFALAGVTAVGFLFRHDHGLYVALAVGVLLALLTGVAWRERLRHAFIYGLLTIALLSPYLLFVQVNGGVALYLQQAAAWAERDRDRAPVEWPGLSDNPDGVSEAASEGTGLDRYVAMVRDNAVAWIYYLEIALPFVALMLLLVSRDGFRPGWPHAGAKLATVAVLAVVLDVGFLRSPLEARLADPSVPLAILVAWLPVAVTRLLAGRQSLRPRLQRAAWPLRVAAVAVCAPLLLLLAVAVTKDVYDRLDAASLVDRPRNAFERVGQLSAQYRREWELETWLERPDRSEFIDLSLYVQTCTAPDDRVLVQGYIPQVLAMARRGFAGGHADLRPGFFGSEEAQALTVARLRRQSVPVILLDAGASYEEFRKGFPIVMAYIDSLYRIAGTREFSDHAVTLLVRRDREPTATYAPLDWPCYAAGATRPALRR